MKLEDIKEREDFNHILKLRAGLRAHKDAYEAEAKELADVLDLRVGDAKVLSRSLANYANKYTNLIGSTLEAGEENGI